MLHSSLSNATFMWLGYIVCTRDLPSIFIIQLFYQYKKNIQCSNRLFDNMNNPLFGCHFEIQLAKTNFE